MDELCERGAGELAGMIRRREVSSREVVAAHLERIERVNPALNAIVTLDAEHALAAAAKADAVLAGERVWGPLHGVPFTLKDCHATAGMRTTAGHPLLAGYVPERDGAVAARLKGAGAILLGKTNVSTLLADVQSDNPVFGRTNNPHDLERTPGGSSGGAGAALAARLTPLEFGSDIGGSIRIPAHCCGVFGLKPTVNRIPVTGHIPELPDAPRTLREMNVVGPMARTVADLALAFRAAAGPDGYDTDVPPLPLRDVPEVPPRGLRVAWSPSFPGLPVARDIAAALERLAASLERAGARVERCLPPIDFDEQLRIRARLRAFASTFPPGEAPDRSLTAADYFAALAERDRFIIAWERFFDTWDVLLAPVMMTTAFRHCPRDTPVPVDGVPYDYALLADYCRPFNLTGHPVVVIPAGRDRDNLPIGIQVAGKRWSDERLLGIAGALSAEC